MPIDTLKTSEKDVACHCQQKKNKKEKKTNQFNGLYAFFSQDIILATYLRIFLLQKLETKKINNN